MAALGGSEDGFMFVLAIALLAGIAVVGVTLSVPSVTRRLGIALLEQGAVIACACAAFGLLTAALDGTPSGDRLSDEGIQVTTRLSSPDGTRVVVVYTRDLGALGYGAGGAALLRVDHTDVDLRRYLLPERYVPVRWTNDNQLIVQIRLIPCLQEHVECMAGQDVRFATPIIIELDDEVDDRSPLIEDRLTSPDGQLDLVAYRYPKGSNLGRVHVSIIPAGQAIPRYGNFFMGHDSGDGLLGGRWIGVRSVAFRTNGTQEPFSRYGFIGNPWSVEHQVTVDKGSDHKYLWQGATPR